MCSSDLTIQGDPEQAIGVENYLRDILTVAGHLGLESFHYAGESLGGMLGMALTALHHDRVRSLTLMSSSLTLRPEVVKAFAFDHPSWQDALRTLGSRGWADAANKNTRFPPGSDPQLLEWYAAEFGQSDVNVLIAMSKVAKTVNLNPHLANIRRPVLGLYPTDEIGRAHV